jgi:hypothetical protein
MMAIEFAQRHRAEADDQRLVQSHPVARSESGRSSLPGRRWGRTRARLDFDCREQK